MSSGKSYKQEMDLSDGNTVKYGRSKDGRREWWDAPDSKGHATYVRDKNYDKMYSHSPNDAPAKGWKKDRNTGEITRIDQSKKK